MSREKQLEQALRGLIEIATGALEHDRAGQCPDAVEGHDARDAECAACKAVMRAEGLLSGPAQAEQSEQQPVAWAAQRAAAEAAQSALAGEREAFEAWHCEKFKEKWHTGHPTRDMHNGVYDDKYGPEHQQNMWEAHQAGAAWQRKQSAGVAGVLIVPIQPTEEMRKRAQDYLAAEGMIVSDWLVHTAYTEMLAAAPAQPAAQELCKVCKGLGRYQDGDSGTDADGRAPKIVDCDCADSERLPQYRAAQDQSEVQRLREALEGMLEYFPEGASDGECFAVDAARAALSAQQSAPERVSVPRELLESAACLLELGDMDGPTYRELRDILASHGRGEA